jgi:hypothetical protein
LTIADSDRKMLTMASQSPTAQSIEIVDPIVAECLRAMTPWQRIQQAYGSNRLIRQRLAAHFTDGHPEWSPEQIQAAVAERLLRGTA